ncbi:MAG: hypothetical protein JNG88_17190 [Phycisphaerales bacterium]|nr:hypothetical protein [Phycisphaerales bacterium]
MQPAEPATPTTQPAVTAEPLFHFDELSFDLGFDGHYERRQTDSNSSSLTGRRRFRQTNTALRLEETVGMRAAGNIGGERVFRYQFDIRGGLSQERYHESRPGPDLDSDPHGGEFEYDIRATLFPAGKISANVFASNLEDRVPRRFLPSLDRRRERYGAELLYNDPLLPMRLSFESEYEELRSGSRNLWDDEQRHQKRLEYEATWQPSDTHSLRLQYEYDDRREQYSGTRRTFDTVRNYLTLDHTVQFGLDNRSRLDTVARFQDETGDFARDIAEFAPQLRLQHTSALASIYRLQYLEESFEGYGVERFRGEIGLQYQPADWFDTSLNMYALTEEADRGGDLHEWGGVLSAAVNRDNAAGRFTSSLTLQHNSERIDGSGDAGVVIAESATFRDPLPVILQHDNVRRTTIVVTDAARRRTYFPGVDYYVVQAGRGTTLVRNRAGRIADGETVAISYRYDVSQDHDLTRDRVDFRVQQAFKSGWTPYYAASYQSEDIDRTNFIRFEPRDVNRHRVGVDYREKLWSVGGEFEYNDDSIDPYLAAHLRGDAVFYDKLPHSFSGQGRYSFYHFRGGDGLIAHDVSMLDVGASYRLRLDTRWEADVTAAYRFEDDSGSGITHGVDVTAGVQWRIGLFTASFEIEYDSLDLPGSDDGTIAAWVKLRREIPVIGGR